MRKQRKLTYLINLFFLFYLGGQSQPTDNVEAYYPFNGNACDVTVNKKNGVASGASLTTDRLNTNNNAYFFDGANDLIYLPNNLMTNSTAFAISCWVKVDGNNIAPTADYGQAIIDLRGQYQVALSYYETDHPTNPDCFGFYTYSSPNAKVIFTLNNSVQFGTWYHLFANYGNNTMEFYVNGALIGTCPQTPPGAVSGYNNTIGKDYNLYLNRFWFYGEIDEVLIYKRSLSASEVQTIYTLSLTQKDFPSLYGPVNYSYDAVGNRIGKNVITLKSGSFIAAKKDTTVSPYFSENKEINNPETYENENEKLKIYPNPTTGELKIEIVDFDFSVKSSVFVYNSAGKLIIQKSPLTERETINLIGYPNGMYILKIQLGDNTSEWKVIKE